jgi:hypothetical protein
VDCCPGGDEASSDEAFAFTGRVFLAAVDREVERVEDPGVLFIHPSNRKDGFLAITFFTKHRRAV